MIFPQTKSTAKSFRAGWVLAVCLGAWLGMLTPSCGTDNAPDPDLRYYVPGASMKDEDHSAAKSELTRISTDTTVMIAMVVTGETRVLGAIVIAWPREEFYKPFKDQDVTLRLDS